VDDREATEQVGRIEVLLDQVEALGDPAARDLATELVQTVLAVYGEGLSRVVARVAERDDGTLAAALAGDELVAHLLLLHGLHPVPLESRVQGALEEMRPYLDTHGGDVALLGVEEGVVRLQLEGSCSGCPSSALTLRHGIETAIHKAAPDVIRIEAQDAPAPAAGGLIQLEVADTLTCPLPQVGA
jgi:Fe-S cluster biogenesis protein NfuA